MKTNVRQVDITGKETAQGKWWMWNEKCDLCGTDCQHTGIMTSKKPDLNEVDFCINCYRELMDQGIPYEEAYRRYKK